MLHPFRGPVILPQLLCLPPRTEIKMADIEREINTANLPQIEPTTSVLDATLLVAGTTVGAGILALPAKTVAAGFGPSTVALIGAWAYMAASGLLIAEVNVNTLCALDRDGVSLSSMVDETLGTVESRLSSAVYVFLHYALLVSYILQGSRLFWKIVADSFHMNELFPPVAQAATFTAFLGAALLFTPKEIVERINSILVIGVVASFSCLLALGSLFIDVSNLSRVDVEQVVPALPVMALSLVYHNVVPTVCSGLGCDLPRIRTAIVAGSALPTIMFIAWNAVILGATPLDLSIVPGEIFDPLEQLRASGGTFGFTIGVFSLLAIVTSFIGFCFGLTDFYADLLDFNTSPTADDNNTEGVTNSSARLPRSLSKQIILYLITLIPPLAFAIIDPTIFFEALDSAGTYGVLTLFGILPPCMAWAQRYSESENDIVTPDGLPGGRVTLLMMVLVAGSIIGVETWERLGL